MRNTLRIILLPLFILAMIAFLVIAFALVFTQVIGLVTAQGQWIDGAYEALARPSIIAAIIVGLSGYAYYTTIDKGDVADD
ncbi:hypothetical protein [Brevibacterium sp. RIT 803]|uniref:hypothetical protein n=1 Tax=Brevibacterium sp. RIT 803 TaxID=2810210 RepID=UPI00194FC288|nr:hypothetical protein [Brevibacterium sp. RIT 803]MBM6590816.1 hypothetical protein [Brevibacterium sp. RIT 803]